MKPPLKSGAKSRGKPRPSRSRMPKQAMRSSGSGGKLDDFTILDLGPQGDGIARRGQERIYIDRVLPGDVVRARVIRIDEGLLRGDVVEIVKASPDRIKAPCQYYDQCGGCTLQHASDDFYKKWIEHTVHVALEKQGVKVRDFKPTIFIPAGTRRRATFAAFKTGKGVIMGYYRRRSHQINEIDECLVTDKSLMELRTVLKTHLAPILKPGKTTDIFVQKIGGAYDVVITGDIGKKHAPDMESRQALADLVNNTSVARVSWRGNEKQRIETIVERTPLIAKFGALNIAMPPAAFMQPTPEGERALVNAVMAALPAKGKFADLFSGCGTFSGPMLERGPVDAYESVGPATDAMIKSKGPLPLKVFQRDLFRNPLKRDEANRYDAIVFDPPRAGAQEQARAMASSKCRLLIGVSCNPATFARDARVLCEGGYRLQSVQIIDQFTWSHHVEIVGVFTK